MTKPWERQWAVYATHPDTVDTGPSAAGWATFHGTMANDDARFAAAAPGMARALLAMLGDGPRRHLPLCHALTRDGHACHPECAAARAALAKAGVPLP